MQFAIDVSLYFLGSWLKSSTISGISPPDFEETGRLLQPCFNTVFYWMRMQDAGAAGPTESAEVKTEHGEEKVRGEFCEAWALL